MAPRHQSAKSKSTNSVSSPPASNALVRLLRTGFTLYLLSAVLYTSYSFVLRPAFQLVTGSSAASKVSDAPSTLLATTNNTVKRIKNMDDALSIADHLKEDAGEALWGEGGKRKGVSKGLTTPAANRHGGMASSERPPKYGVEGTNWGQDKLNWHAPVDPLAHHPSSSLDDSSSIAHNNLDRKSTPMAEDFFLSKAFGESLQPSKVVPYYFKASAEPAKEDITITTLVTSNRFKVFAALVERYQGWPNTCAFHLL